MKRSPRPILLVEDDPDQVELGLLALAAAGIAAGDVVVARDGVEALALLHGAGPFTSELPALVLLDLKLPRLDGIEVLRRMRAEPRTRDLPVVVLTSSIEDRDVADSYASGANSYVRKPVDSVAFDEAVRRIGEYWLRLNHPPPPVGA